MTCSQAIRQNKCFALMRKFNIHDAIVKEASDEGVSLITIWRKLTPTTLFYLHKEYSVLSIEEKKTKGGYKTLISVGTAGGIE